MSAPIITLTSDFGPGVFVGVMKGVILDICPQARLIDLEHNLPPQNIRAGALVLEQALPYFPIGTVHLAVVDPGVGTARRAICLKHRRGFLVGPDNGLFSLALEDDPQALAYEIGNPDLLLPMASSTFHGRDIFAPAAAHLAAGADPAQFGPVLPDPVLLDWPQPIERDGALVGQVIWADHFGNLASNITRQRLRAFLGGAAGQARIGGLHIGGISKAYGDASPGEPLALINSWNRLELALNQGDLARSLGFSRADSFGREIFITPKPRPR